MRSKALGWGHLPLLCLPKYIRMYMCICLLNLHNSYMQSINFQSPVFSSPLLISSTGSSLLHNHEVFEISVCTWTFTYILRQR